MRKNMKIKFLIIISLFIFQTPKSQVFSKSSNWIEVTTNVFDETIFEISEYKIKGDTLIDDKNYSKVLRNNEYYSALRETEDNKIYAYLYEPFFPPLFFQGRELLIYDFDWYPGKELYCQTAYADSLLLTIFGNSIDSIQLLNEKYYKYFDRGTSSKQIRGIGNTEGFFISTFYLPGNGNKYSLLCFYIDDTLVYSNPNFNYCNTGTINYLTDNDSKIKLYPNPSNYSITVEFLESLDVDTFSVFDIKGSLIIKYEVRGNNTIEIKNLAKGAYVYFAVLKNNQKLSGKIIIQ